MSDVDEQTAFFDALNAGTTCSCRRCGSGSENECRRLKLAWLHPADVWTIRALRTLSTNGSFR